MIFFFLAMLGDMWHVINVCAVILERENYILFVMLRNMPSCISMVIVLRTSLVNLPAGRV